MKENLKPCAYKHREHVKCDRVLFVERSGELIFAARLSNWSYGAAARASLNRAYEVAGIRPETG